MFFALVQNIFAVSEKVVDKPVVLCLNVSNIQKDFDGKFAFSGILSESRWMVRTGENGEGDLIPESVV